MTPAVRNSAPGKRWCVFAVPAALNLQLLHVAAALRLKAKVFFRFDDRQREAAAAEGLKAKP